MIIAKKAVAMQWDWQSYSNSELTVLSYVAIFENLWIQAELKK